MPSAYLLDVNFLIALAWPNHTSHVTAMEWFMTHRDQPFATCPMTEAGFVRISMNPLVVTEPVSRRSACDLLKQYQSHFSHIFWSDSLGIGDALAAFENLSGHRQITDAYLLALAAANGGSLVTLDLKLARIAPNKFLDSLIVVA